MIIRRAREGDVSELADMSLQFLTSELAYDRNLHVPSKEEFYNFWIRTLDNQRNVVLVAEEEELLGYVYGWFMRDFFLFKESRAYISDLFVKPEFRGNGVGSSLLTHIIDVFRKGGVRFVYADVYCRNTSALGFWKKNGFDVESFTLVRQL